MLNLLTHINDNEDEKRNGKKDEYISSGSEVTKGE